MKPLKALISKNKISKFHIGDLEGFKVSLKKEFLYTPGYIVKIRTGEHYITLGNEKNYEPKYVTRYRINTDMDETIMVVLWDDDDWDFLSVNDYKKFFPLDYTNGNYDIIEMYKAPFDLKDIYDFEGLKKVYKKYNLTPMKS